MINSLDNSGNIYIADNDNDAIRKVNSAGIISTFGATGLIKTNANLIVTNNIQRLSGRIFAVI
jgi:hypothetical protein